MDDVDQESEGLLSFQSVADGADIYAHLDDVCNDGPLFNDMCD